MLPVRISLPAVAILVFQLIDSAIGGPALTKDGIALLKESATHVVVGRPHLVYEAIHRDNKGSFKEYVVHSLIIEILVDKVERGEALNSGGYVYVHDAFSVWIYDPNDWSPAPEGLPSRKKGLEYPRSPAFNTIVPIRLGIANRYFLNRDDNGHFECLWREDLDNVNAETEGIRCEHDSRYAMAHARATARNKAILAIEKLGGSVQLDANRPYKPVIGVRLAGQRVDDAGLAALEVLTELESLHLAGSNVTDAGLGHLKKLTKLERVDLRDTKVTAAGIKELQATLRQCEIDH